MFSDQNLVSIRLMVYNNERYIEEAIRGVYMQITTFNFEIVVGDDFSNDRTLEIIRSLIPPENVTLKILNRPINGEYFVKRKSGNHVVNFLDILENCSGKYIALLDGDDYWTDPYKLQKQVDFLERNIDFSIVWTKYGELKQINGQESNVEPAKFNQLKYLPFYTVNFENFNNPYVTQTMTCVFRKDLFNISEAKTYNYFKDNTLYALLLKKGKGALLNFNSGAYRIHQNSIYALQSRKKQAISNYSNFYEIVKKNPNILMPSIIQARNYWEKVWLSCIKEEKNSLLKEWKLRIQLKWNCR